MILIELRKIALPINYEREGANIFILIIRNIALFGELSLEEAMDLSQDRLQLDLKNIKGGGDKHFIYVYNAAAQQEVTYSTSRKGIARTEDLWHATVRTRIKNLVTEESIMRGRLGNDYVRSKIKQKKRIKKPIK
jgi:hypothetical protein